ncbi:MAG: MarR family transcriptional regulator [Bacteroidales bacterium]
MTISTIESEILFAILSGKVSSAINRRLYRRFREEGIEVTPEQWTVLHYLWDREGVTQQELCQNTFKDKPSMTRLIDNLEKQHLVERRAHQEDRRINMIYLTPQGRDLESSIQPVVANIMNVALEGIPEDHMEILRTDLSRIFNNIRATLKE